MSYNPLPTQNTTTGGYVPLGASQATGYTPITKPSPVPGAISSPSPYFSAVDKVGNSFGFSDQKDISGKPFFAFRSPGDTSTTTDKTRVATYFDPRVAAPIDHTKLTNGRMPESVSSSIKKALGGQYSDELDHAIALELSGSNDKSNLIIQKGRQGGEAAQSDTLENSLARQVVSGKKSLFDAQKEIAKNKGVGIPFTGEEVYKHPGILQTISDFAKTGYDTLKNVTLKDVSKNTVKATAETTSTALEGVANFVIHAGNLARQIGGGSRVDMSSGKPVLTKSPQEDVTHKTLYGQGAPESFTNPMSAEDKANLSHINTRIADAFDKDDFKTLDALSAQKKTIEEKYSKLDPAKMAGQIVGGAVPFLFAGAAAEPIYAALAKSSPLVQIFGKAFINAGIPALIQATSPLKEGESQKSRFENNLPSNLAFGLTSIIPNNITSAFATGLSQFGIGKLKGEKDADNVLNSALLTIFGLVGHTPVKETGLTSFEPNLDAVKERMKTILTTDLGKSPHPNDVMTKAMAGEFMRATPEEQKGFIQNVKDLLNKTIERYKQTPGKEGGFVKNPLAENPEEKPQEETKAEIPKDLQPLAEEARKYESAEEFAKAKINTYHGSTQPLSEIKSGSTVGAGQKIDVPYISKEKGTAEQYILDRNVDDEGLLQKREDVQAEYESTNSNESLKELESIDAKLKAIVDEKKTGVVTEAHFSGKTIAPYSPAGRQKIIGILKVADQSALTPKEKRIVRNIVQNETTEFLDPRVIDTSSGIRAILKENGIDGLEYPHSALPYSGGSQGTQIAVLSPEKLLTKSQLTDFYNKAVGESATPPLPSPTAGTPPSPIGERPQKAVGEGTKRSAKDTFQNREKANFQLTKELQKDEIEASKHDPELTKINTQIELLREELATHPGKALRAYARNGALPEVTGKSTIQSKTGSGAVTQNSLFGMHGDKIIQEILGMGDTYEKAPTVADAQKKLDEYKSMRKQLENLKSQRRELVQKGREFRNKEKSKAGVNRMIEKTTVHSEEPNQDFLEEIKTKKTKIAKQMSRDQADAVTAFFEQNPDVLDDYEESGKIEEKMQEFMSEYLSNISAEAQNEVNEVEAQLIEESKEEARARKLDAVVAEYKEKGVDIDRKILEENGGVVPPSARGGLRSPQFDVASLKDVPTLLLTRDTFERNIEKVAPPDVAHKINQFYTEKIRNNEKLAVEFKNEVRKEMRKELEKLGINVNTPEDRAIQIYGERMMPIDQLMKEFPGTWQKIVDADILFRHAFDRILPIWNELRVQYGYKPVAPVTSKPYYRHHTDRNPWWGIIGSLPRFQSYELPTEIAGLTENFTPGKKWTSAELHRSGNRTHYSAIKSLDDYLENVVNQMFHIDSIQRGRAIEKYIRAVAKISRNPGSISVLPTKDAIHTEVKLPKMKQPVNLPNFVTSLHEHTNLIAGKNFVLDRAFENGIAGRNVIAFANEFKKIYGINVIGANLSSALTHMLPVSFNLATVDKIPAVKGLINTLASPLAADFTAVDGQSSSFLVRRYPERSILPTKYEKITGLMGAPFEMVDKFISRLAVTSKYYEGLSYGLSKEAAMTRADNYAGRVIGSRSTGDLPNIMKSKTLGFFTQFQIEVNDNLQVLIHDIPQWSKENVKKGEHIYDLVEKKDEAGNSQWAPRNKNYAKIAAMLGGFLIFSHLVNYFLKKVKGSGKGLDLIQFGLDLAGLNDDGIPFYPVKNPEHESLAKRALTAGGDLLGELPFTNFLTGSIPAASALPNPAAAMGGKTTWSHEFLTKPFKNLISPVGGGSQLFKTAGGLSDFLKGYKTSASGKTKYPIEKTTGNAVKAALFGSGAFPADTQVQINRNKVMPTYEKVKELAVAGKKEEAIALFKTLSPEDRKEFTKIDTSEKRKETLALELKMQDVIVKLKNLVASGKKDEAKKLYAALSVQEKHALMLLDKKNSK